MTQVPASDYSSTELKEIDLLIRQINSKELTNGELVGIFIHQVLLVEIIEYIIKKDHKSIRREFQETW